MSTGFKKADGHRCGVRLQMSSGLNKSFYIGLNVDGGINSSTTLLEPKNDSTNTGYSATSSSGRRSFAAFRFQS